MNLVEKHDIFSDPLEDLIDDTLSISSTDEIFLLALVSVVDEDKKTGLRLHLFIYENGKPEVQVHNSWEQISCHGGTYQKPPVLQ